jgi:hypothetical protein
MIKRGEISSYETLDGDNVSGDADPVELPLVKARNITRKPKI